MSTINSTTSTTSYGPTTTYINGLISGLNTTQIIQALMQQVEQPQIDLENQVNQIQQEISDYQQINSDLSALQSAADALENAQAWQATTATSSDPSSVSATSSGSGTPGSISFSVNQLATANVVASAGTVSSTSAVIASSPLLVSVGGSGLGLTSLAGNSGLALGSHTIQVTQALSGAEVEGSTMLPSSITITTGTNDTITYYLNGSATASSLTIPGGTYTPQQLATAIANASGGSLQAEIGPNGQLVISTTLLGSGASLQITGGDALGTLGLSAMSSAATGSAGSITVDGTPNAINNVNAGSQVNLTSGTGGSITATLGQFGLSLGSLSADNVSVGNGSLASVVQAINSTGLPLTASAVQTSSGTWKLQIASNQTGAANDISINPAAFSSTIGQLETVTPGQNANLVVGSGQGAYMITSGSNTIQNLLPGLDVSLLSTTTSPVTVTLAPDVQGLSTKVSNLVNAANTVLQDINKYAGYNSSTNTAGPLMSDPEVQAIANQILSIVSQATGGQSSSGGPLTAADVGINLTSSGQLSFDSSTFQTAFSQNPTGVAAFFEQGGSFSPSSSAYSGSVSLAYASDSTQPGSYQVVISHSATQATDLGSASFASAATSVGAGYTITVSSGGAQVSYTTQSTDTVQSVANDLNAAFAAQGMGIQAEIVPSGTGVALELQSQAYGSAATFTVGTAGTTDVFGLTTSGTTYQGTDVAGTIGGVTATGQGQVLSAPSSDPNLGGLSLLVTASGITSATNIGTFTYQPGLAGSLGSYAYQTSNPVNGVITDTINNLQAQSSSLSQEAASYDPVIAAAYQSYLNEFANMESELAALKAQGNWLTSAIAGLQTL